MKKNLQKLINSVNSFAQKYFNVVVLKNDFYNHLLTNNSLHQKIMLFEKSNLTFDRVLQLSAASQSQLGQDIFALSESTYKQNGFFVEFGAADGLVGSNTYLLEKFFNWKGILAEPARIWHDDLLKNRSCSISFDCVLNTDNEMVDFSEVSKIPLISTLTNHENADFHKRKQAGINYYKVKTIRLQTLLKMFNAPNEIDFLSIDTEGTELEILEDFDFSEYRINTICVEHNFQPNRIKIQKILKSNGYKQVFTDQSKFDDWFIKIA